MNIPSYAVKVGDVVMVKEKSHSSPMFGDRLKEVSKEIPVWLERKGIAGKVVRFPERQEIREAIEEQLIVEYFSR